VYRNLRSFARLIEQDEHRRVSIMRIFQIALLSFGIPLLLAACGSDETVTERTTTTKSQSLPSDTVTTERKTTVDD
jgi:hypothetical protein